MKRLQALIRDPVWLCRAGLAAVCIAAVLATLVQMLLARHAQPGGLPFSMPGMLLRLPSLLAVCSLVFYSIAAKYTYGAVQLSRRRIVMVFALAVGIYALFLVIGAIWGG